MDEEKMIDAITKTISEKLPEVAEGIVEGAIDEKMKDVTEAIKNLNENIKLGNVQKEELQAKEEAKEVMAKYFKFMAKKQVEEANAVLKEYSAKATYGNEATDAEGGYLVPREFAREVFYVAGDFGLARKLSMIIPMGTNIKSIPSMTNSIVSYWTDEGIAYTGSKLTFGNIELIAYKMTVLASNTIELVDDNQTNTEIWNLTTRAIAENISEFEDTNVFVTSTKFTALLEDATINEVVMGAGSTSFADITFDNIIDLKRAVSLRYKKGRSAYFMSEDCMKYIEKLKDTSGQYIYYPSRNINDDQVMNGPVGRLNGSPVYLSEVFPEDADDGVDTSFILFGDMKYRAFGDRKQLSLEFGYLSGNREKDIKSLKANQRIAGKVMNANAFAKLTTAGA